ncbi:MAG: hypothetical protein D4R40_02085 [Nitrosomonadaceae bacterium]|nr:MAG: hypothetical protein D4R40_02085 [Nitrosomonadaceae bacterium]
MSAYLARLKQLENVKNPHYASDTLPPKPPKAPFDPFVGTGAGHIEKNIIVDAEIIAPPEPSETAELNRLVHLCGEFYGFTEAEHTEALAVAMADFDSAMLCFTTMAREIQAGKVKR